MACNVGEGKQGQEEEGQVVVAIHQRKSQQGHHDQLDEPDLQESRLPLFLTVRDRLRFHGKDKRLGDRNRDLLDQPGQHPIHGQAAEAFLLVQHQAMVRAPAGGAPEYRRAGHTAAPAGRQYVRPASARGLPADSPRI